tara:strand:+ start:24 stop:179 length:156 start_codon:yes stop_codon:yes gene_type:complete
MNLNLINEIISNKESRKLFIEIVIDGKKHIIDSLQSDFDNEVLKIIVKEKE